MHITVKWFNDSFNVGLCSKEGSEEFLSIKGCRLKEYDGKRFVGFPAQKNEKTQKWWNHVWASDKFQAAVIEQAEAAMPKQAGKPAKTGTVDELNDDIPW